ncbi:MAG: tetratricopeptide (TPR) repeat protein, partial [Myxococcota bacterium]
MNADYQRYRILNRDQRAANRTAVVSKDLILGTISFLKFAPYESSAASQLMEEAGLLSDLSHPNLVEILDVFVGAPGIDAKPVTGFAMRWIDGAPLDGGLSSRPLEEILSSFCELLEVVDYLHRRGVLHLDIKPDNVLLSDGGVVLLDLGSARPVTSGPGEAGGTVGYAAPEVMAGQAATVAADIFSLGALLYELITGVSPYGSVDATGLRRAILSGDIVPVRVIQPAIPRELARLCESMLSVDVPKRPANIEVVAQALGYSLKKQGSPPFLGSESVRARLDAALAGPPRVVHVIGPAGSGRQTLIKHTLRAHIRQAERLALDLTDADDPARAIQRLAGLSRPDLPIPLPGPGWVNGVSAGLRTPVGFIGAIYMGRREDHPAERLQRLEQLTDVLIQRGCVVIWAGRELSEGLEPFRLQPLGESDTILLGRFFGVTSHQRLFESCRGTGGWPGALIQVLQPSRRPMSSMERKTDDLLRILYFLPRGIPEPFVQVLSDEPEILPQLLARESTRWGEDGRLYLLGDIGEVTLDESTLKRLRDLLVTHQGRWADPLWTGLTAARVGNLALAEEHFERATGEARHRPSELEELCARLIAVGYRPARLILAELKEGAGDLSKAASLLMDIQERTPSENLRLVRVLRRARRLDEADALARTALDTPLASRFWLEIAFVEKIRENVELAEDACNEVIRLEPGLADNEVLAMRLRLAALRLERGEELVGIMPMLESIEARALREDVPNQILIVASLLLKVGFGELDRSQHLLALAVHRADRDNDQRSSAGLRINLSNILKGMGRRTDARRTLKEALQIAEELGSAGLLIQIRYSLATLELEAGRLPAARQYIDRFERDAQSHTSREIQLRARVLRGQLLFYSQEYEPSLKLFRETLNSPICPESLKASCQTYMSRSLLALGRAPEVLALLEEDRTSRGPVFDAFMRALKGRAHLSIGRSFLAEAMAMLPEASDPAERLSIGEIYLSAAGEDLDPATFTDRRETLDRAARLLRGERAAQAATLRDRISTAPGVDLAGVVALTEAMRDPQTFPTALARLITEALGANRVLIMLRIPGLGKQISVKMLSGGETAGISSEVLRRIQKPDDYWLAADAFGDPSIRNTSKTVQTFELKSLLAVAIPHGGKAVGALYVDDLYRAGRFDMEDVKTLKRLARAVGDMLPLLGRQHNTLVEPKDILGVQVCNPEHSKSLDYSLSMLKGQGQTNLLISGETGTGKSVLARRIAREVLGLSGVEVVVLR